MSRLTYAKTVFLFSHYKSWSFPVFGIKKIRSRKLQMIGPMMVLELKYLL